MIKRIKRYIFMNSQTREKVVQRQQIKDPTIVEDDPIRSFSVWFHNRSW